MPQLSFKVVTTGFCKRVAIRLLLFFPAFFLFEKSGKKRLEVEDNSTKCIVK